MRIDILNFISGVSFDDAYKKKIHGEFDGMSICFISVEDFIENKKASGRHKDLGDIELLKKQKRGKQINPNILTEIIQ